MRTLSSFVTVGAVGLLLSCSSPEEQQVADTPTQQETAEQSYDPSTDSLRLPGELHFRNVRQLTFGGNNAEAYWSFDDKQLVFQSDWEEINDKGCDQIYVMNVDGSDVEPGVKYKQVSPNLGRTTCSYFLADGRVVFGSTESGGDGCPTHDHNMKSYVWPIFDSYDIYVADADGSNREVLIGGEGYDAEATVSPDGKYLIFTSTRSGDLELWRYEMATGDLLQLTNTLGYDGGAFFSRDSKKIIWRASRPEGEAAESYKKLLKEGLVEPKSLNVFVADVDGSNAIQVTDLPGANWAPFMHPDGESLLFCSNHEWMSKGGRFFDIFRINLDGTGMEKLTNSDAVFSAFPMFSYDGSKIAFASNRVASGKPTRATNVFVADWIEHPERVDSTFGVNTTTNE